MGNVRTLQALKDAGQRLTDKRLFSLMGKLDRPKLKGRPMRDPKQLRESARNSKIMRAAVTLQGPFTLPDLAVATWKMFQREYGLAGYRAEYPDYHKVFAACCGVKGLRERGWLVRVPDQDGYYRVSDEFRRLIEEQC